MDVVPKPHTLGRGIPGKIKMKDIPSLVICSETEATNFYYVSSLGDKCYSQDFVFNIYDLVGQDPI